MKNKLNEQGFYLDTQQQVALGVSAASDFFSIIPTYSSGVATKQAYEYQAWQENQNAEALRADAQDILYNAYEHENKVRIEGAKVRGEQRVAMGASGFEVSSDSYRDLIENTDYNIARNAAAIRREATTKYASTLAKADYMDVQADYMREAGKIAKRRAKKDAIFNGIIGAAKLGAMSYFAEPENMGMTKHLTTGNKITNTIPVPTMKPSFGG